MAKKKGTNSFLDSGSSGEQSRRQGQPRSQAMRGGQVSRTQNSLPDLHPDAALARRKKGTSPAGTSRPEAKMSGAASREHREAAQQRMRRQTELERQRKARPAQAGEERPSSAQRKKGGRPAVGKPQSSRMGSRSVAQRPEDELRKPSGRVQPRDGKDRPVQSAQSARLQRRDERVEKEAAVRQKKVKKKRNPKVIVALLLFVALLGCLGFLGYKFIRAEDIRVKGNTSIKTEDIVALSGIQTGTHIFRVDRAKVEENISKEPHLRFEDLVYTFPNILTIEVSEREEVACFEFHNSYVITDENGVIVGSETEPNRPDLPIISGINITEFVLGAEIRTDDTFKQSVMKQLLTVTAQYELVGKIDAIDLADINSIGMTLKNGMKVIVGQAEEFEEKMLWLTNILSVLEAEGKTGGTIDVSSTEAPIYQPDASQTPVQTDSPDGE